MPKKQKRDTAYYLDVVERKHPAIHARYLAGDFASASAAILAAGVRKPPKQIHALLRAWKKASASEQLDFLASIGVTTSTAPPAPAPVFVVGSVADSDRRLTPWGRLRIAEIMDRRGITMKTVMDELGELRLNTSISRAIHRDQRLPLDLLRKLKAWVDLQ